MHTWSPSPLSPLPPHSLPSPLPFPPHPPSLLSPPLPPRTDHRLLVVDLLVSGRRPLVERLQLLALFARRLLEARALADPLSELLLHRRDALLHQQQPLLVVSQLQAGGMAKVAGSHGNRLGHSLSDTRMAATQSRNKQALLCNDKTVTEVWEKGRRRRRRRKRRIALFVNTKILYNANRGNNIYVNNKHIIIMTYWRVRHMAIAVVLWHPA